MREMSCLDLTRFVQFLFDRKDRMSMAGRIGGSGAFLRPSPGGVRVQHPLALETFDGREKEHSPRRQRASCCRLIVERAKNPYPSTQDPAYEKAVRADVAEIFGGSIHPAAPLLNRKVLEDMLVRTAGKQQLAPRPCRPRACALDRRLGEGPWRRARPAIVT